MGVDPNAVAIRPNGFLDRAGTRHEIARGIFGVDAAFDRAAFQIHLILRETKALPLRDGYLLGDEIDAGDLLRHGMLDLNPRIHFEEIETLALDIDQKLDRTGAAIVQMLRKPHAGGAYRLA